MRYQVLFTCPIWPPCRITCNTGPVWFSATSTRVAESSRMPLALSFCLIIICPYDSAFVPILGDLETINIAKCIFYFHLNSRNNGF